MAAYGAIKALFVDAICRLFGPFEDPTVDSTYDDIQEYLSVRVIYSDGEVEWMGAAAEEPPVEIRITPSRVLYQKVKGRWIEKGIIQTITAY